MEKTKTVAVGDGGTTIEVRASERGRCMATVHGRDKKLNLESAKAPTLTARAMPMAKLATNRYRVTSPGITLGRRFRGRNTLDSARTVIR